MLLTYISGRFFLLRMYFQLYMIILKSISKVSKDHFIYLNEPKFEKKKYETYGKFFCMNTIHTT